MPLSLSLSLSLSVSLSHFSNTDLYHKCRKEREKNVLSRLYTFPKKFSYIERRNLINQFYCRLIDK